MCEKYPELIRHFSDKEPTTRVTLEGNDRIDWACSGRRPRFLRNVFRSGSPTRIVARRVFGKIWRIGNATPVISAPQGGAALVKVIQTTVLAPILLL